MYLKSSWNLEAVSEPLIINIVTEKDFKLANARLQLEAMAINYKSTAYTRRRDKLNDRKR